MEHILVAAFDNRSEAEQVKRELMNKGVSQTDIRLAASNDVSMTDNTMADNTQSDRTDTTMGDQHDESMGEKISGFFRSIFSDNDTHSGRYADTYPEAIRRGSTVLTVTVANDAQVPVVEEIMERNGAIDIDERSSTWTNQGMAQPMASTTGDSTLSDRYSSTAATMGVDSTAMSDQAPSKMDATTDLNDRTAIPVMEEELKVGKRENSLGRVRVVSRMTERPVEEAVNLHEEHAVIERRPVDRPASAADMSAFSEGTVEIQETAEEAVVEKNARVVEEVMVGKQGSDHTETIRDTVRRTDVDVEKDGTRSHLSGTHDVTDDSSLTTRTTRNDKL
ncbi:uncharacterized protein (TIGR02271 family) [Pseudomonas duriflava]|uniref:Uncharacterized protein (TIGR02271 family) n=1 Tax=Pseudomonas duriflava TaxID=459528 RepID=A0A562QLP3_9PSED|nr:YsnF/AvaK domain-containing protein [Pseudomonas duriflava]TWI57639.1 uncharacterized protein (TIGR02271 family) [Pseudomonas duriflava]